MNIISQVKLTVQYIHTDEMRNNSISLLQNQDSRSLLGAGFLISYHPFTWTCDHDNPEVYNILRDH